MWWALVPIMIMAYLWFGAFLGKKFYVSASGKSELEDGADVVMIGFVAVVGPVALPFFLVGYGVGKLACKLTGLKTKKKKTKP